MTEGWKLVFIFLVFSFFFSFLRFNEQAFELGKRGDSIEHEIIAA